MSVSDGKCRPQLTRLKLCPDFLVLQREEFIFPDDDDGYTGLDNKVSRTFLRAGASSQKSVVTKEKLANKALPKVALD